MNLEPFVRIVGINPIPVIDEAETRCNAIHLLRRAAETQLSGHTESGGWAVNADGKSVWFGSPEAVSFCLGGSLRRQQEGFSVLEMAVAQAALLTAIRNCYGRKQDMGLRSEYWCMAEISDNRLARSQDPVGDAVKLINDARKLLELGTPISQLVDPCAKNLAGVFLPLCEEDFEASMPVA